MRFFADENLERTIIEGLQALSHDVSTLPPPEAGESDQDLLARCRREGRILITNDKDFAEISFLQQRSSVGIVLVRLPQMRSIEKAERVVEVIVEQGEGLQGFMSVIEAKALRKRALLRAFRREES